MTNADQVLVVGSVDCNDQVNTFLVGFSLGKPLRAAAEYGGPAVDIARIGSVDSSASVESRFVVQVKGSSVDGVSAIVAAIAEEVRDLSTITVGLRGSAYVGTLVPLVGECIEIPQESPWDSRLVNQNATQVEIVVRRKPWVYAAAETLANAAAVTLPAVASLAAQTGEAPSPYDLFFDFATLDCNALYAGRYPDDLATIADFAVEAADLTWSSGAAAAEAAGYPDGAGNTVWRNQSATPAYADIDVTDFEPGEYLLVAKCKATTASTGTLRHTYCEAVAIPTTTLQLLSLGVVTLPCSAVRAAATSSLRVYLAGDGANYGYVNAFFLVPASFGGLVGWRRSSGHAHTLRFEDEMLYADDVGALGEAFGGRRVNGLCGTLVVLAEQVSPSPTTACAVTITDSPRFEQLPHDSTTGRELMLVEPLSESGFSLYDTLRFFGPVSSNRFIDPSFEVDSNADGIANGWTESHTTATAPTFSLVAGRTKGYAQRWQHTSATEGDRYANLAPATEMTGAAPGVAAGDTVAFSFYHRGSISGCNLYARVDWYTGGSSYISSSSFVEVHPTADWARYEVVVTAPANAVLFNADLRILNLHSGDSFDLYLDDCMIGEAVSCEPYFDGSSTGCSWAGTANASVSTRAQSVLTYDPAPYGVELLPRSGGTIFGRVRHVRAASLATAFAQIKYEGLSTPGMYLQTLADDHEEAYIANGASYKAVNLISARSAGDDDVFVMRYGSALDLSWEAVDGTQATGLTEALYTGPIQVGQPPYGGSYGQSIWVGPIGFSPYSWSSADRDTLMADDGALLDDIPALLSWLRSTANSGAGYHGTLVLPLTLNSSGYLVGPVSGSPQVIVVEGDSHSQPDSGNDWAAQLHAALGGTATWTNVAVGGEYLGYGADPMLTQAATEVDPLYESGKVCVCLIWGGANDISAARSAAQVYADLQTYCAARRAVGWQTIVFTYLGRQAGDGQDAAFNVTRNALNALIRGNHSFADGLADIAADSRIGDDADPLDLTYFNSGGVHMNAAGKKIVAGIVRTTLLEVLA